MEKRYDICILGATAYASGFIKGHSRLSYAVIESGCVCAPEFSVSLYDDGSAWSYVPKTESAKTLKDEFIKRGALDSAGVWLPAVSPLIAKEYKESGADCYFMSAVTDISLTESGYFVKFFSYGIEYSLYADKIIDTTTNSLSHTYFGLPAPHFEKITLTYISDSGTPVFSHFSPETDTDERIDATKWRDELISGRRETDDPIIYVSPDLFYKQKGVIGDIFFPSSSYGSFIRAFDEGASADINIKRPNTVTNSVTEMGNYDLIVVGLGTAGAISAITASGEGLRVLGLENLSISGGSSTAGGILGYYYGFKGGVYCEIDKKANSLTGFVETGSVGAVQKDVMLSRYMSERKVECRFNAYFTRVDKKGEKVAGVFWTENGVKYHAFANFVIDCTAEAVVAVSAGAEMTCGRDTDGQFQPYSSVAFLYSDKYFGYEFIDNGTVNPYNADEFGKAILSSSTCYLHLKESYQGHSYFGIAPLIGLREGRRIKGEERITFPALLDEGYTDKPVYFGNSNLDNHGKDWVLEDRAYQDWVTICGLWGWGMTIPVPAGALIPKGIGGLLCAGRNVSVDHDIAMGLRMKDDCSKSGEAAALLAVLAIRHNVSAKEVSYDELKPLLYRTGCLSKEDMMVLEKQEFGVYYKEPYWCKEWKQIETGLGGNEPGYFIWSCRYGDYSKKLYELLSSKNKNAVINSALALALTGHKDIRVVTVLKKAVEEKDTVVPNSGRNFITMRAISAISALGKTGSEDAISLLLSIVNDSDGFTADISCEPYFFIADGEDISFQFATTAIGALCEIAKAHPKLRKEIYTSLKKATMGKRYIVSMMGTVGFKKDVTESIQKLVETIG